MNASLFDSVLSATMSVPAAVEPQAPDNIFFGQELFEVETHNLTSTGGKVDKKGLFVNGQNINIVSDSYEVHQPIEIAKQFQKAVDSHGLTVNRVVSNPANGGLLLSAKYANLKLAGDENDINLTFYTSHCGKYKSFLTLDTLRIACFNQLPMLYRKKERFLIAEKHYKNTLDIDSLGSLLQDIPESIQAHNSKLEALKDTQLSLDDFIGLWEKHYKVKKDQKQYQSKVDKMRAIYYTAPGQDICPAESAYKALQAITFANTHEGRNTAMKVENSMFKGGDDSLVWMEELLTLEA